MHPGRKQKDRLHKDKAKQPQAAGRRGKKEINQKRARQNTGNYGNQPRGHTAYQFCINALIIQAERPIKIKRVERGAGDRKASCRERVLSVV